MRTVTELFRRLEQQRFTYAVLRNYEHYPDLRGADRTRNTDVDVVIRTEELPQFRKTLASLAADCGWDVLTECDHYSRSPVRHHNIEVFQFYRASPLDYLQIDVFHAYLVWGLPFMDEKDLLAGRLQDRVRGLTHIDPVIENTYRLVQVHGLGDTERTAEKRARYRRKIETLRDARDRDYLECLQRYFGRHGIEAADALRAGDTPRFGRAAELGKRHFFLQYALRHPIAACRQVVARRRESRIRLNTEPCGCVLAVSAPSAQARSKFSDAMDRLMTLNALDEWAPKSSERKPTQREIEILEQGGVLVEWTDHGNAHLAIDPDDSAEDVAVNVLNACVHRHRTLYLNEGADQCIAARLCVR